MTSSDDWNRSLRRRVLLAMADHCPDSCPAHSKNQILQVLQLAEWQRLGIDVTPMPFQAGHVLFEAGDPVEFHYFPETCVISLARVFAGGDQIVAATVGCEGMVQLSTAIDRDDTACLRHVVQIGGDAVRIRKSQLAGAIQAAPPLRQAMIEYAAGFVGATLLSVACNRAHRVEQRLARWLLATRDRTSSDHIPLTHDDFAEMLGVHRPTVSVAAGELEARNLISCRRGQVTIVDRDRLEQAACECYHLSAERLPATCHTQAASST